MRRFGTYVSVFALASSLALGGCYGSFGATKALHSWNGEVTGNKFLNWLVFVALNIVPVYGLFVFADGLVLNSIEFWTGSNPVASADGLPLDEEGRLAFEHGGKRYLFAPIGPDTVEVRIDGVAVGLIARGADGSATIEDWRAGKRVHVEADGIALR